MAIRLVDETTTEFRAHTSAMPDVLTMNWCDQRHQMFLTNVIPEVRNNYLSKQGTVFAGFDVRNVAAVAQAMGNFSDTGWIGEYIQPLLAIDQMQQAPVVMLNYIMANPYVRDLYQRQQIEGYYGRYVDNQPGVTGEEHIDYQHALDGLAVEAEDDLVVTEWANTGLDQRVELTTLDQVFIQQTWAAMVNILEKDDFDPTSAFNARR